MDRIPIGTRSLLFGAHQVIIHPLFVTLGWIRLYGLPRPGELLCIVIHDWGYWGKPNIDGPEGEQHTEWAANVAGKLMGKGYHDLLCLLHSRHYSKKLSMDPSCLCWADKLSLVLEPWWLYLFRVKLSGELAEFRENARRYQPDTADISDRKWFQWIRNHFIKAIKEGTGRDFGSSSAIDNSMVD